MNEAAVRETGWFAWLLQRVTGVFLVVYLLTHWYYLHYHDPEGYVIYEYVKQRLSDPFWRWVDISMLAVMLYHGFNGILQIVLDYRPGWKKGLGWVLAVIGLIVFILGTRTILTLA